MSDLVPALHRKPPDAVLVSLVSWQGRVVEVPALFGRIRHEIKNAPILIADYAHAGAVGFPHMTTLTADIVCGDFAKWVGTPAHSQPAFIWVANAKIRMVATQALRPFFLATERSTDRASRWLAQAEINETVVGFKEQSITRTKLLSQFEKNCEFAKTMAKFLHIKSNDCCILVAPKSKSRSRLLKELQSKGLAWPIKSGTRILCRRDIFDAN